MPVSPFHGWKLIGWREIYHENTSVILKRVVRGSAR